MAHASSLRFWGIGIASWKHAPLFLYSEAEEALAVGGVEVKGGLGEGALVEGGEGGFVEVEGFPGL